MRNRLRLTWDLHLQNCHNSHFCFWLALLHSMSYLFPLHRSLSPSLVFDAKWSNIDEVLSVNPSSNGSVFGEFNIHYKYWLTYSSGNVIGLVSSLLNLEQPHSDGQLPCFHHRLWLSLLCIFRFLSFLRCWYFF